MKDKNKPGDIPELGQAHDTCGGNKHVLMDQNLPNIKAIAKSKQIKAATDIPLELCATNSDPPQG